MTHQSTELLTVQEVAKILMTGKNQVYDLLQSEDIKAFRIGRVWKIPRLSVEEYIMTQSRLKKEGT